MRRRKVCQKGRKPCWIKPCSVRCFLGSMMKVCLYWRLFVAKHPAVCASLSLQSVDGPVSSGAQVEQWNQNIPKRLLTLHDRDCKANMRKLFYMMDHDGTILSNFFTEAGLLDSLWQKIASKHLSLGVHLGHFDWTRKKRQTNWDGTSWNCLLESFTLLSCNLDFCLNSFSGRPLRQVEANRDTYMLQKYAKIMFCLVLLLTSRLLSPKGLYQTMGPDNKWQQDLPVYQQEHSALT